jgi:hypothetical protein
MRLVGDAACSGEEGIACRTLVGKPEGKRPIVRTLRRRLKDNIKIDLREIGWGVVD